MCPRTRATPQWIELLCTVSDIDLPSAYLAKLEKTIAKYPADIVRGSAAKYTEYRRGAAPAAPLPPQPPQPPPPVFGPPVEEAFGAGNEGPGAGNSRGRGEWGTPDWVAAAYDRAKARVRAQERAQLEGAQQEGAQLEGADVVDPAKPQAQGMPPPPAVAMDAAPVDVVLTPQERAARRVEELLAAGERAASTNNDDPTEEITASACDGAVTSDGAVTNADAIQSESDDVRLDNGIEFDSLADLCTSPGMATEPCLE